MLLYLLVIKPLSLLPLRWLHYLSDFLYVVLYKIAGYRKKIVRANISNSFPEKTELERLQIEQEFYRHFSDVIVETIKSFSISANQLQQFFKVLDNIQLTRLFEKNKNIILVTSHYNNWEWGALAMPLHFNHNTFGIYQKLSNAFWNRTMLSTREQFGIDMVEMKDVLSLFRNYESQLKAVAFIADQSPFHVSKAYWATFLNQETPVYRGPARFAQTFDYALVYGHIQKKARSQYEVTYELLAEDAQDFAEDELTQMHLTALEKDIQAQPAFWLWTHKRWKRANQKKI
ncbi:MAG: lysophospholipid acyltransferase family protein [Bacteroidetes bacterium]|nr:lysophospholipid acyltransferase family protein [Bacteroidota bacterium]